VNSLFFFVAVVAGLGLAGLLFWALRGASQRKGHEHGLGALDKAPRDLNNMPQIRQSMDPADFEFAKAKGGRHLETRLRRERRNVALLYLAAIRRDFEHSLRVARVIAVLSPEVSGSHEYERIRLAMIFRWRFQMTKARLLIGIIPQPQLLTVWRMAASIAMQMEETMAKLGERAALAAELALQSEK
jgi:hypothetical protein